MRTIIIVFVLAIFSSCGQRQQANNTEKTHPDKETKSVITGKVSRDQLEADSSFADFFREEYSAYQVSPGLVAGDSLNQVDIKIVLGTWCHDSQMQVPRFFKILDHAGYTHKVKIIAVNTSKDVPGMDISNLGIDRVPTFIILHDDEELGRIIESPVETLEEDLSSILRKNL